MALWLRRVPKKVHAAAISPLLYVEDAEEGGCGGGGGGGGPGRKEYFVPVIANGVTVEDKKWGMGKLWMKFGAAAQFPDGKWARERVVAREW